MITETGWKIIEQLAGGDRTPTELAQKLGIKIPSVFRQLKELEKEKKVEKLAKKGKTRPFTLYSLGQGFVYFMEAVPGKAQKIFLSIDEHLKLHLNIWSIPQKEFHYFVEDYWWQLKSSWPKIAALVVYGSVARGEAREGSDIDVLILTHKKEKSLEKKYAAGMAGTKKNNKIVMAQIFSVDEFKQMLKDKSKFAQEVVKDAIAIYDPKNLWVKDGP